MLPLFSALSLLLSKEFRRLLLAALSLLAIGLVAASPAAANSGGGSRDGGPKAHAAGGAAPIYPSIVNSRLVRGEKALERATDYVDQNMQDKAVTSLLNARRNMYSAWRGAKYLIDHAPPPVQSGSVHRKRPRNVHVSGGAPVAASVPETAFAVLNLQHDVAATAFGLMDGAKGTFLGAVNTTVFAALNRRDQAIAYILKVAPPAPASSASVRRTGVGAVHTSGTAVTTFDTVMPGLIPQLDDEIQQIEGLQDGGAVVPKGKTLLDHALLQDTKTERTVNQYWPPLPAG